MLFEKAAAALELQFTDRVYRTEYSVLGHSALIERVTGEKLTDQNRLELTRRFCREWDMCLNWNIMVNADFLGEYRSSMGHAVYAEGGSDRNDDVFTRFKDTDEVFAFDPCEKLPVIPEDELIRRFEEHYRSAKAWIPDMLHMTGTYITCMSGLIDMLGWDMLLSCAGEDAERFGDFTDRYAKWIERFFIAMAKSSVPYIMVHDDIVWTEGAFINPAWYRKYIFPNYKRCFRHLHEAGKKILFTSDGNYTEFIDDIADCGIDCFVLEPLTDMSYIAEKYGKTHSFIGNADTRILLGGTREDIYNEVKRCMDIGKKYPGFIMAVGNHIPANTPVDSCLWYDEFCRTLGKR
ncbi:MAG: uroporphyrinogen decarboxylase family protein [Eubacteriales bacterium]